MSGKFASDTSVPVEKTRAEIESVLSKYGAECFAYATEPGRATIAFRIEDTTGVVLAVRMVLPIPPKGDRRFTHYRHSSGRDVERRPDAVHREWEQACRSLWRALLLVIKAKLEACTVGISTVEREFLADVVLPGGGTVGEWVRPQLPGIYASGGAPKLLPGGAT